MSPPFKRLLEASSHTARLGATKVAGTLRQRKVYEELLGLYIIYNIIYIYVYIGRSLEQPPHLQDAASEERGTCL